MVLKLVIGYKGKAWRHELEGENLFGKSLGDIIKGEEISQNLNGFQLQITGGSDKSGFPMYSKVEGQGLKRVLLKKGGWGLHKRPKGNKKRVPQPNGLRMRKTVRGKQVFEGTVQLNLKILTEGNKMLKDIFPDQNVKKEAQKPKEESKQIEVEKPVEAEKLAEVTTPAV